MANQEIEHKYLVSSEAYRSKATQVKHIRQGYLCIDPKHTVRIRLTEVYEGQSAPVVKAYMTVKAKAKAGSIARFEWEKELSRDDFEALFPHCLPGVIEKNRFIVPFTTAEGLELKVEVDEFHGLNEGLVLGEIELPMETTVFEKPDFLGDDVTGDMRYYNSYLIQRPYITW